MRGDVLFNERVIDSYWKDKPDSEMFIRYLLDKENWTLDHNPKIESALSLWVNNLCGAENDAVSSSVGLAAILTVLGFIVADKSFYLLNIINSKFPSLLNSITAFAQQNLDNPELSRVAFVFFDRLRVANQHTAIKQSLGVDRLAVVQYAIKRVHEKHGGL
jgi:hypothetical protein